MTQKRFSATQYALFSSLFGLPRIVAGPIAGYLVDAVGWSTFFWLTIPCGIPGLLLLARFVPVGVKEPMFTVEPTKSREPLSSGRLVVRGLAGGLVGAVLATLLLATVAALKAMRGDGGGGFELGPGFSAFLHPAGVADWVQIVGVVIFGAICGLFVAAVFAARHGTGQELAAVEDR